MNDDVIGGWVYSYTSSEIHAMYNVMYILAKSRYLASAIFNLDSSLIRCPLEYSKYDSVMTKTINTAKTLTQDVCT